MFKILSTYICRKKYIKCNIWWVVLHPSYIEDAWFLKVNYKSCMLPTEVRERAHLVNKTIPFHPAHQSVIHTV